MKLPEYVVVVSRGPVAYETRLTVTLPDALAWCARAMRRHDEASQVAIVKPQQVYALHVGSEQLVLVAVQGWRRDESGWHSVPNEALELELLELRGYEALPQELDEERAGSMPPTERLTESVFDLAEAVRNLSDRLPTVVRGS